MSLRELQADVIRKALHVDEMEDAVFVADTASNQLVLRRARFSLTEAVQSLRTAANNEGTDPADL